MDREAVKARGGAAVREHARARRTRAPRGARHPAAELLGLRISDAAQIIRRVEQGLGFQALEAFQKRTAIPTDDLAAAVDIKLRTLHRRRKEGRLEPDESDRLLRLSTVYAKALELFEGDAEAARRWFYTPARALSGEAPIALSRTDLGTRQVEALIDRLEQGILS